MEYSATGPVGVLLAPLIYVDLTTGKGCGGHGGCGRAADWADKGGNSIEQ